MERKKLGDFCKLRQGFQVPLPNQETELKDGYVRFIRIVDYTQETNDIRYVKDSEKFYHVKPDDVVMVRYGAAGEVGHGISGVIANNMFLIDPLININKDYLYYYLAQNKIRLKLLASSTSTTMPALNFKIVNDLQVPLYERDKQDEIVAILDKLSSVIEKRKNEITALDELIKARFVEMFGNPEQNEKSWKTCRLGDECRVINGRAYKAEELLDEGKYRVLRVGNFFTNDSWYYSDLELDEDKYCEDGDLLFAWSASFGPRIWRGEKVIYHYHIWKLIGYESCFNKDFLVELLNYNCDVMKRGTHGSTMLHFTKSQMEEQKLILPPMELQNQFTDFVHQVNKSKVVVQKALDEAHLLFDSLMQEYFE